MSQIFPQSLCLQVSTPHYSLTLFSKKRRSPRLIVRMQLTLNSAHFVWYTILRTSLTGLGTIIGGGCDRKLSEVGLSTSRGDSNAGVDGK